MTICVICTGVVWLESPAVIAIALSVLHSNVAICKLTACGTHKMYKKHKTHPDMKQQNVTILPQVCTKNTEHAKKQIYESKWLGLVTLLET